MTMWINVVLFAGGGGSAEAFELAGLEAHVAINHDPEAIAMHRANHPRCTHFVGDVFHVTPDIAVPAGCRVASLWASPDCTHFSRAKNGKPRSTGRRALADVVLMWAREVRPLRIYLENVEEFLSWGPLDEDGNVDKSRRGEDFRRWVGALEGMGYVVEWKLLRACDFGAPTTRKRLFLVARCDGEEIRWPEPTHGHRLGQGWGLAPFRTAADCIDWSVPTKSIFGRPRPLATPTLRRIARGLVKHVLCGDPFLAPQGAAATLIQTGYGERPGQTPRALDIREPIGVQVAGGAKHAVVLAFLAKHYGGNEGRGAALGQPMGTVTCADHHALVAAELSLRDDFDASRYPRRNEVGDLLYLDRDWNGSPWVAIGPSRYEIVDVGMRMLTPREMFNAQGFRSDYVIDVEVEGRRLSKTAQARMAGNSVAPQCGAAVITANEPTDNQIARAA